MVDHPHWHAEVLTAASTKTREAAWSASLGGCLLRLALARDCDCSASFPMSLTLRRVRRSAPRVRLFVALLLVGVFSGCVEAPAVPTVDAAVKDMACECVPQESVFESYDPCRGAALVYGCRSHPTRRTEADVLGPGNCWQWSVDRESGCLAPSYRIAAECSCCSDV